MNSQFIDTIKSRIINIFTIKNSTVKKNFLALSILQITNYVFPLITVPYVSRIFGPDVFGLLNFATSILAYFWLLVNYGFDLSASRDIAQNRDNIKKVNEIFNNVLFSKLLLYGIATILFLLSLFFIEKIYTYKTLYLIMFFGGVFNIFFPTWFFQGMEKLTFTALFTFIVRFIFTVLIFVLIKTKDDYLLYPFATILGQIIVSVISLFIIKMKIGISIKLPDFGKLLLTIKDGWNVFLTVFVINIYLNLNVVILGFLSNDYNVGIYTSASKIVLIINSLINLPLAMSIYPNIAYSFKISIYQGIMKISKYSKFILPIVTVTCLFTYLFSNFIIKTLYGHQFIEAINVLKIISFIPILQITSNFYLIQGLLNLRSEKIVAQITLSVAILSVISNLLLIPYLGSIGAAISWLISEIIITIYSYNSFKKELKKNNVYLKIFSK